MFFFLGPAEEMIRVERLTQPELADNASDDSDDSGTSGDEIPVWVRGEQKWVSGVGHDTTCADLKTVLLQDEATKVSLPANFNTINFC